MAKTPGKKAVKTAKKAGKSTKTRNMASEKNTMLRRLLRGTGGGATELGKIRHARFTMYFALPCDYELPLVCHGFATTDLPPKHISRELAIQEAEGCAERRGLVVENGFVHGVKQDGTCRHHPNRVYHHGKPRDCP